MKKLLLLVLCISFINVMANAGFLLPAFNKLCNRESFNLAIGGCNEATISITDNRMTINITSQITEETHRFKFDKGKSKYSTEYGDWDYAFFDSDRGDILFLYSYDENMSVLGCYKVSGKGDSKEIFKYRVDGDTFSHALNMAIERGVFERLEF